MKFEWAMAKLRKGQRLRNAHWPEAMYIVLMRGYPDGIPINEATSVATGIREGTTMVFRPYFLLHAVDGSFVPWVASQSDLLSEVWQVIHLDEAGQPTDFSGPAPGAAYADREFLGMAGPPFVEESISVDDLEPPFAQTPAIHVNRCHEGHCKDE